VATVGRSNIDITADDRQAKRTISGFFKGLELTGKKVSKRMSDFSPFEGLEKGVKRFEKTIGKPLKNLPEHLKPFHESLNDTRLELRKTAKEGTSSLDEMADATLKSSVAMGKLTSVSKSGKSAIKTVQELNRATKETQLAILGLNENGELKISSEESARRLEIFQLELQQSRKELERLREAGDFASYEAGMEQLEKSLYDVDRAMRAASKGGKEYNRIIDELGVNTSNRANEMAIAMEGYKDRFLRSLDYMNARSTQSQKMMDILPEVSHIQTIDRAFLSIGNRMEEMAKRGTAANLAISMLGKDASMKDIAERIKVINSGLGRMIQVAMYAGVAFAAFTAVMFSAAKGPDVGEVLNKQAEALANYEEELQKRTDEIRQTWSIFEDVQLNYTSGKKLMNNLQEQVDVLKNWRWNLATIADKAGQEFSDYLSKMGPAAAGEVAKLSKMSEPELDKYVALWREKSSLARKQAETELEGLRIATQMEIKKLQASITPLGESIERFKATWASATGPFVEFWGQFAAKVVDAFTAIGKFVQALNEMNPSITRAAGMFMYLFSALMLILAPMAIGIGRANGMKAAFTYVFNSLRPLILGFLRVAGMASVLAAGIVIVVGTFMKMWDASEKLRNAVSNLWNGLVYGVKQALEPLQKAWNDLKKAWTDMMVTLTGSEPTWGGFFKLLGDGFSLLVDFIGYGAIPIIKAALEILVIVITKVMKELQIVFGWIADFWTEHGPQITQAMKNFGATAETVFSNVKSFAADPFGKMKEKGSTDLEELRQLSSDIWTRIKTQAQADAIELGEIAGGMWGKSTTKLDEWKTTATTKLGEWKTSLVTKLNEWGTAFLTWFDSIPEQIKTKLSSWKTAINQWMEEQNAENKRQYGLWWESISLWFSSIPGKITTKLGEWWTAISTWFASLPNKTTTKLEEWWTSITIWLSGKYTSWTIKLGEWWTSISTWFTSLPAKTTTKLEEWWTSISTWFTSIPGKITLKLGEWWTAISTWFTGLPEKTYVKLEEWWTGIKTWFSEIPSRITTALEEWWVAIKTWFSGLSEKPEVKNAGKNMVKKMEKGLEEQKPTMMQKLGEIIVDVLIFALAFAAIALLAAGREIITRVLTGMSSMKTKFGQKWEEFKQNGITKLREMGTKGVEKITEMKDRMIAKFEEIRDNASEKFEAAKKKITGPLEEAYDTVTGILADIKAAFEGLSLKIPKPDIPEPEFSYSKGNLLKGVMPSFSVKWHARGGFFDSASIIGIGEEGREAAVPLVGRKMDPFAFGVARKLGEIFGGMPGMVGSGMDRLVVEVPVFLDKSEVARVIAPDIDKELARRKKRDNRAKGLI
jgi:hypothetical protein